jgi:hypothetical protein
VQLGAMKMVMPVVAMILVLDELLSLSDGLLADRSHSDLSAARTRIAQNRFNLVVLGEFKRGKSTLINALIGRELLPTGVLEAKRRIPRLLVVLNKLDHLDQMDRDQAVDFVCAALSDLLGTPESELFAISARTREGIDQLMIRQRTLATDERDTLLMLSVAGLARVLAADTAQAARFETHAINLPLGQLASRTQLFERRIKKLRAASEEAGDLLDNGVRRAVAEQLNEPLRRHAEAERVRLQSALRAHVQERGDCSARELSADLERWVDATVRADFKQLVPRFEGKIAEQLTQLEHRYAARVEHVLEQVQEVAKDVFGARSIDALPRTGLRAPSRFSFKLEDVEHALDMIVGFGRTMIPGALGRRFVLRDADQRLTQMTDRHAGRLRSELAERASAAAREYRRELTALVDAAIEAIRGAIERAADDRNRGEEHGRARLDRLAEIECRCAQLANELSRWGPNS